MSQPGNETPEAAKARQTRNIMLALALVAFVVLVFFVTVAKMSGNVG